MFRAAINAAVEITVKPGQRIRIGQTKNDAASEHQIPPRFANAAKCRTCAITSALAPLGAPFTPGVQ
jgi:hypothetical protein